MTFFNPIKYAGTYLRTGSAEAEAYRTTTQEIVRNERLQKYVLYGAVGIAAIVVVVWLVRR